MNLSFAPLEGITTYVYRQVHAECFGGADAYYAPFIAPDGSGTFKASRLEDIRPENNRDLRLIPQVLANSASAFLLVADQLRDMGYDEVNLNVGCPSGTVFAKHKGAGMLQDLASLDAFLAEVYAAAPVKVSVKTRMGVHSTAEFGPILDLYNKYPLSELIIHARDRDGQYVSTPDFAAFQAAFSASRCPFVTYNGNVFTPQDVATLQAKQPGLDRFMLSRGAVANPALFRAIRGGAPIETEEIRAFQRRLTERLLAEGYSEKIAVMRLKEQWHYIGSLYPDSHKQAKAIFKAKYLSDYQAAVDSLLTTCTLSPDANPGWSHD